MRSWLSDVVLGEVVYLGLLMLIVCYWIFVIAQWRDTAFWRKRDKYLRERSVNSRLAWRRGKAHLEIAPMALSLTIMFGPLIIVGMIEEWARVMIVPIFEVIVVICFLVGGVSALILPFVVTKFGVPTILIPPKER